MAVLRFNVNQRQKFIEELGSQATAIFVQRDRVALLFLVHVISIRVFRSASFL